MKYNTDIIGRVEEQNVLQSALKSPDPEFIAVYGRRRVGKTFLVSNFFKNLICFEITGIHNADKNEQLENFSIALGKAMGLGIRPQQPSSWFEAFRQLEQYLSSIPSGKNGRKKVVFIDELPWLNTPKSGFLSGLEHFWNSWGSKQKDFILIICGSAASWMIQNVVKSKGGLHNRITRRIRLLPFTLRETELFLKSRGIKLTRFQITELYMAIGGIPHYLKQVEKGLSANQIIDKLCFSKTGLLYDEFDNLFSSLFDNSNRHLKVIKALAKEREGMTRNEILEKTGLPTGGTFSRVIDELEESGFIQSYVPFGKKTNEALFWLSDEYTLFYLLWIAPLGKKNAGNNYWLNRTGSPKRKAWAGYAFERVCIKHISKIKEGLGITGVETTEAPWRYIPKKGDTTPGAQIDLLIDRKDQTINLCEMKFSESEFSITKKYAEELRRKTDTFRKVTKTKKNIFITMITPFGVSKNQYYHQLVRSSMTLEQLF